MKVIRADMEIPADVYTEPSIFLVGPTPRDSVTPSWRPVAITILKLLGFDGLVLVPERDSWQCNYLDQVEWEYHGLEAAAKHGCISAWIPRDLITMPAFTTNVEFGHYVGCGRFIYGRPDDAPKNMYLDWMYEKMTSKKPCHSLNLLMEHAIEMINN